MIDNIVNKFKKYTSMLNRLGPTKLVALIFQKNVHCQRSVL